MRLKTVSDGVSTTTYKYNGDGDRISQTIDGTLTTYTLDVAGPLTMVLAETTGANTIHYFHALGLVAESDGTDTDYFIQDGLGSVRQLTDPGAGVLLAQTFDPYGNPYASAGTSTTSFGFTGEQVDANGLLYLRARYYNPAQGRFFQMDPSRQEANPYSYSYGNPINLPDPSGTLPCDGLIGTTLTKCLDKIENRIKVLTLSRSAGPGYKFASEMVDHYLSGSGETLDFGPEDFSIGFRRDIGNTVLVNIKPDLLSKLQISYGSEFCAGELPLRQQTSFMDLTFAGADFSPSGGYHFGIGTASLSSPAVSVVTIKRSLLAPKRGKVSVMTPIELYDSYDWCYGQQLCEAKDVQGPSAEVFGQTVKYEIEVGEFFALEKYGRAVQFDWYAQWFVKTEFDIDGTSGVIQITRSRYVGYEEIPGAPLHATTALPHLMWNSTDSEGKPLFDDDWHDANGQLCTIAGNDKWDCVP